MAKTDQFIDFLLQGKETYKDTKKSVNDMTRATNGIKTRAKDLILQYPVLVSNTLSQETVAAVTRALEHEYANLMVLLINDNNIARDGQINSTQSFLNRFHNNVLESGNLPASVLKNANLEMINEVSDIMFNDMSLNNMTINSTKIKMYNEADYRAYPNAQANVKQNRAELEEKKNRDYDNDRQLKNNKLELDMKKLGMEIVQKSSAQLVNTDVKKLNDMSPTIVKGVINVTVAGAGIVPKELNFGVKAVAHLLDSEEIVTNLSTNLNDASLLVKFIEWTTGEKRLFTDLIMRKDDMKRLASAKGRGSHWFRKLELAANSATTRKAWKNFVNKIPVVGQKIGKLLNFDKDIPIPTISMVISRSEVDQIRAKTGVDLLRKEGDVKALMNRFYLLSFIIVDDTTEMVYIYDEVSKRYITYSLKQLKGFAKDDLLTPEQAIKRSLMR